MNRGISTIEILIALAIMVMTVTASSIAGIGVPGIVADARNAAASVSNAATALNASDASIFEDPLEDESFERRVSRQQWVSSRGIPRSLELWTVLDTSIEPEACDPFTSGDWSRPALIQSYGVNGTVSSLATSPGLLAVGIASTSQANSATVLFLTSSGTSSLQLSGGFDNASNSRIGNSSVAAHGHYIFTGNAFGSVSSSTCTDAVACAQISAYISGSIPMFVSSLAFATSSEPFAYRADGSNAPVSALAYYHGFLYAGLQKTAGGDEFNIIDANDPYHLRWISGYRIGRTVNGITLRNGFAFVSTDDPSRELLIFDVQDPAHPALHSVWNAPGSSTFGYGSASTVHGDSIRFGRTYSTSDPEFELLNMTGASTTEIEHIDSGTTKDPESVRALLTQDRLTFMLLTHRLDVLDTHDSARTSLIGSYALPADSQGSALACRNNQLYVAWNSSDGTGHLEVLQGL